jgi:hypothetical protein
MPYPRCHQGDKDNTVVRVFGWESRNIQKYPSCTVWPRTPELRLRTFVSAALRSASLRPRGRKQTGPRKHAAKEMAESDARNALGEKTTIERRISACFPKKPTSDLNTTYLPYRSATWPH